MPLIDHSDPVQTEILAQQYSELVKSGTAPHPQSPAGAALLAAYGRWQAQKVGQTVGTTIASVEVAVKASQDEIKKARKQAERKAAKKAARKIRKARKAAALAGPALEERALRRSEKRLRAALEARRPKEEALAAAFRLYREQGGRLTQRQWGHRVSRPA